MIEMRLPVLQEAVEALYHRITAGRVRALGKAAATGLTGRVTDQTPDELGILEAALGSRYGARLFDIWMRDDLHVAGASEDDWALASEIAYQAIQRGLTGDDLTRTVERIMRAGPYRSKWDAARRDVTWLAQDVANAVATVQKRLADRPNLRLVLDDFEPDEQAVAEDCPQTVTRIQRELAEARATIAVQRTVINGERERRVALEQFVTTIDDVLANPDLTATDKVVSIVITRDLHTRLSQGRKTMTLGRVAERAGMHKNTVGKSIDRLSTGEGAPFEKVRKRNPEKEQELGHPVLDLYITPRGESARDTLAVIASYVAPEDRPKRGASPKAAENRWKRCEEHPTADVLVQGACTDCGDTLGDRRIGPDEFEALKHTLGVSGIPPHPWLITYLWSTR